jgi:hypothetical protein
MAAGPSTSPRSTPGHASRDKASSSLKLKVPLSGLLRQAGGMHMDSKVVRLFVAVGERLSFSRAAADLHIAQPWLSTQIRKLESQLGFELFTRTSRRVALTEDGQILLSEARGVVAALDKLDLTARSLANAETGKLRIGLPEYSHNFPMTWKRRSRPDGRPCS